MNIFFDSLIAILVVSTALPAVILLYHRQKDPKSWEYHCRKVSLIFFLLLLSGAVIVLYGSFIEPRFLLVKEEGIDLKKINKPIKIVLMADIQVGPYRDSDQVNKVVKKILSLKPDLVLMAGDHINNSGDGKDETVYLQPLQKLAEQIPVYAVHGNHEYGVSDNASLYDSKFRLPDWSQNTKEAMEELGVRYLVNELEEIAVGDQSFYLFGGDSYWAQNLDLGVLKIKNKDLPVIALIHNPVAVFDVSGYDVDLMLSGHTHGGQVRLPFIGPIIPVDNVIPRKWHQGWVEYDGLDMYVTSGAGETGTRARLFTPPEIVLLTVY
ncbi:MAG: metallophosphoesterase [bacterium]